MHKSASDKTIGFFVFLFFRAISDIVVLTRKRPAESGAEENHVSLNRILITACPSPSRFSDLPLSLLNVLCVKRAAYRQKKKSYFPNNNWLNFFLWYHSCFYMPRACSHDVCEILIVFCVKTQMRGNENAPSEIKTQLKTEKEPWLFHGRLVSLKVT